MALPQQTRHQRMRQLQAEILRLQNELYVCEQSGQVTYWPVPMDLRSFVEKFCGMVFLVTPLWQLVSAEEIRQKWQQHSQRIEQENNHAEAIWMSDEWRSIIFFDLHEGKGWISDCYDQENVAHRALFCRLLALMLFYQHDANPELLDAGEAAVALWHWCEKASCEVEIAYWREHGGREHGTDSAVMRSSARADSSDLIESETTNDLIDVAEKMREMVASLGTFIVKMKSLLPDSVDDAEEPQKRIRKPRFLRQHEPVAVRRHVSRVELHSAFVSSMSLLDELNASIDDDFPPQHFRWQLVRKTADDSENADVPVSTQSEPQPHHAETADGAVNPNETWSEASASDADPNPQARP